MEDLERLRQADAELRAESPALWWFAAIATAVVRPWVSMRVWWLSRKLSRTASSRPHGAPGEYVAGKGSTVIEGEYQVLQGQKDGAEPPQT